MRAIDHERVTENTPLRLDVAAQLAFPDGSISLSSLRREAAKGRLTLWRVAGKDMTTLAEIREMLNRCRVEKRPHDSGCAPLTGSELPSGSSRTATIERARAAAQMRLQKLRDGSVSTSPASTIPAAKANVVVPMKSR